jgi:hypothetical protein
MKNLIIAALMTLSIAATHAQSKYEYVLYIIDYTNADVVAMDTIQNHTAITIDLKKAIPLQEVSNLLTSNVHYLTKGEVFEPMKNSGGGIYTMYVKYIDDLTGKLDLMQISVNTNNNTIKYIFAL